MSETPDNMNPSYETGLARWYPLTPHPIQDALSSDKVRVKVVPAGRRSGKTEKAKRHVVKEALKIPGSTTHTITGAIMGVGATKRLSAVRWGVTINLIWAWVLTIPISGLLAGGVYFIVKLF